jgi:hypothetical protein
MCSDVDSEDDDTEQDRNDDDVEIENEYCNEELKPTTTTKRENTTNGDTVILHSTFSS